MAANNTFSTPDNTVGNLNGLFKETYADKMQELIPDGVKLLNKIKFMSKEKQPGNLYHQPVVLGMEHGVTFASSEDDAFNLNPPLAGAIKDAQVRGNPLILRSVLGYVAASRATKGGPQAFMDATKFIVSNMLRSVTKKLEIEMLYGQIGYATVDAGTTTTVQIKTAQWAPGIWAGAEGMPIEFRDSTGASSKGEVTVVSVNFELKQITISAALTLADADVIWHKGAYGNEFAGIHKILSTTTGTMFNINVSTYSLFRGNIYSAASGALSFTKVIKAVARAVEKGLETKVLALVNPRGWSDMLSDQAALRQYDSSYGTDSAKNGSKSLTFFSQNGEIEIEPSIYVKEGYAYILSLEDWYRVGSTDVTFKRPGQGDEFFRDLENAAGYEMRLYTDQAVFCHAPARNVLIELIVNAA